MAGAASLASCSDHSQGSWRHAVDAPVSVAVQVADGDAEPAVVGADDIQVEAGVAGDVELGLLARIRRLVELAAAAGALSPRRLCNEEEMISWDSRNSRS